VSTVMRGEPTKHSRVELLSSSNLPHVFLMFEPVGPVVAEI